MWEVVFHSRTHRTDLPWAPRIEGLPHVPEIYRNYRVTGYASVNETML